jgi:hypothetical protein
MTAPGHKARFSVASNPRSTTSSAVRTSTEVPESIYDDMGGYEEKRNIPVGGNPHDDQPPSVASSMGSLQDQNAPPSESQNPDQSEHNQKPSSRDADAKVKPTFDLDTPVSLPEFRMLLGMSPEEGAKGYDNPPSGTRYPHVLPRWVRTWFKDEDPEAPTSIYYNLVGEEKYTMFKYRLYDWIVYGGLITQLVLSAVLIVLGALPSSHHISIAILGAANGVVTGILSIIKGQGLPVRLIKYADSLRKVRDDIEWNERQLRAKMENVTYRTVFKLRDDYERVRLDELANHPDIWQTSGAGATGNTTPVAPGVIVASITSKNSGPGVPRISV